MKVIRFFCLILTLAPTVHSVGQDSLSNAPTDSLSISQDSLPPAEVVRNTSDQTFVPYIKTVLLQTDKANHGQAILRANQPQIKLRLSFDDLRNDYTEYTYEFEYCDRNWVPEERNEHEFYQGTASKYIEDVTYSSATKVGYAHYEVLFPPDLERFIWSGNYLLHVRESGSDSIVLTRRFVVVDPRITIKAEVKRTDDVRSQNYMQQIVFELFDNQNRIEDVSALDIVITKNRSWDIYCRDYKPSFVNDNQISYLYTDHCYFEGGNEYRDFNMIEFKNISNNIIKVDITNRMKYHMWLDTDKPRSFLKYSTAEDINGRIKYTGDSRSFEPTKLDYATIHFTLDTEDPMLQNEIYLFGEMTSFQIDTAFRMNYNPSNGLYERSALLKQGYYNYQYVVKSPYQTNMDESLIEGSHYETSNDYSIYVYYHSRLENRDMLIGIERISSGGQ
ncbi:MAG TPA: hypothetical protein DCX54_05880 [Flavobacteriales bacterium]|nr:hypothetical protein [Flavobacteriales bacterium]